MDKKIINSFDSHEEAENADFKFFRSLSPKERVQILLELIANYGSIYYDGASERFERVSTIIDRKEC